MYNRQQLEGLPISHKQEEEFQELLMNSIIQEQVHLPIIQIIIGLRQGRTQKVAIRTNEGFYISAVGGGGGE